MAEKITLPDVYHRIRSLIALSDTTMADFVEVINLDSTLAARIIKIANSHFFGYSRNAETVNQSISLIGVMQLHDLLLSSLAIRAFSGIPSVLINQAVFWRSCVYCGITARLLAKKCRLPASERLFTSGLLHEIGHIIMYAKIPEQSQDVLFESEKSDKPLFQLEREKLGFDYAQVGSEIMRLWQLPESYCEITAYHIEPEKAQQQTIEMDIVNLARSIMLVEEQNSEQSAGSIVNQSEMLTKQKITDKVIDTIKIDARLYVDEVMDCLWPFSANVSQENETMRAEN